MTSDTLHETFGQMGAVPAGPEYAHPRQDEIVRDAVENLSKIPEGLRLVGLIKEFDLKIRVITGREPNVFTPDGNTVVLVVPKAIQGVNPDEIACNLGIGIKEIEINLVNIQRLSAEPQKVVKKTVDIVIEMCRLVSEFHDLNGSAKLVDLLEKLGHGNVYRMYRAKASYEEMANQVVKSLT